MKALVLTACSLLFSGCVAAPPGVAVVKDFELQRYLDNWNGIARPVHRFEHGA
jgi:apolipoprotein D and lipocalin family protein